MGHVDKTLILKRMNIFEQFGISAEKASMSAKEFEETVRKVENLMGDL